MLFPCNILPGSLVRFSRCSLRIRFRSGDVRLLCPIPRLLSAHRVCHRCLFAVFRRCVGPRGSEPFPPGYESKRPATEMSRSCTGIFACEQKACCFSVFSAWLPVGLDEMGVFEDNRFFHEFMSGCHSYTEGRVRSKRLKKHSSEQKTIIHKWTPQNYLPLQVTLVPRAPHNNSDLAIW